MNILIVNAFGKSLNDKKKFASFCTIIKNLLKKLSENSGIDNFNFIYRTPNTITDFNYNYECNPGEESKESLINKKNFDKLDMIFIDGNEKYLPWENKGYRLCEFIRLCKATNKILFAAGVALEILIYYLATGSNNIYNFINSKGLIQAIEEIDKIPFQFLKNLKKNDYFLDYVTGDILEYHTIEKTWNPIMNIGLHKQIAAEKYMSRGKFILPDNFKGKDYIKNEATIISNCHEILNIINRQYLSHYLVNSVPNEFVGFTTLTWFPHFFNVFYRKYHFKAICKSDKGISVIEHENSVGVAFHPQMHYRETVKILENFIKYKFREVQVKIFKLDNINKFITLEENEVPMMFRKFKLNDDEKKRKDLSSRLINSKKNNKINIFSNVKNSIAFNRIKKVKNEATHVGFGFNNRDMIFVENNSIIQKPLYSTGIQNLKNKKKENEERFDYFSLKRNENTRISEIFKPFTTTIHPLKTITSETDVITNNMKNIDMLKNEMEKEEKNSLEYLTFIKRDKMDENQLLTYYKKTRRNVCLKLEEIDNMSHFKYQSIKKNKNAKSPKKKMKNSFSYNHKSKNRNFFKKEDENNKIGVFKLLKKIEENQDKQTIDPELNKNNIYTEDNNMNQMENEYRTLMGITPRPIKTAILSKNINYLKTKSFSFDNKKKKTNLNDKWKKYENFSPEQIQRKEFLESKKKWLSKEDFHRVFGLRTTSIKPIPNIMNVGEPVSAHKYREIHPEKWITPNGFI